MESNASMHRVGIVLGIVATEGGHEVLIPMHIAKRRGRGFSSASFTLARVTKSAFPTILDIGAPNIKGVSGRNSEHSTLRTNGF
jgi:hypothetical protein